MSKYSTGSDMYLSIQRRVRRRIRENQRSHSSLYHSSSPFEVVVIWNNVLDRIKVDGQGVLVVESDASHFTYGHISILVRFGNPISSHSYPKEERRGLRDVYDIV
jgi:hypothetical protein